MQHKVTCPRCDLLDDLGQWSSKCGPQLSSSASPGPFRNADSPTASCTQEIENSGEGASNVLVQTLQVVLMPTQAWEPLIWSIWKADKMKCEVHRHWIVSESI